eukprot:3553930-Karenia_brevis.AAC.1
MQRHPFREPNTLKTNYGETAAGTATGCFAWGTSKEGRKLLGAMGSETRGVKEKSEVKEKTFDEKSEDECGDAQTTPILQDERKSEGTPQE